MSLFLPKELSVPEKVTVYGNSAGIVLANDQSETTLTAEAPNTTLDAGGNHLNLANLNTLQLNGDAGIAGQVLTSSGSEHAPGWRNLRVNNPVFGLDAANKMYVDSLVGSFDDGYYLNYGQMVGDYHYLNEEKTITEGVILTNSTNTNNTETTIASFVSDPLGNTSIVSNCWDVLLYYANNAPNVSFIISIYLLHSDQTKSRLYRNVQILNDHLVTDVDNFNLPIFLPSITIDGEVVEGSQHGYVSGNSDDRYLIELAYCGTSPGILKTYFDGSVYNSVVSITPSDKTSDPNNPPPSIYTRDHTWTGKNTFTGTTEGTWTGEAMSDLSMNHHNITEVADINVSGNLVVGGNYLHGKTSLLIFNDSDINQPNLNPITSEINIYCLCWFTGTLNNDPTRNVEMYLPTYPVVGQKITVRNDAVAVRNGTGEGIWIGASRTDSIVRIYGDTVYDKDTQSYPDYLITLNPCCAIQFECVKSTNTLNDSSVYWLVVGSYNTPI